MGIAENLRALKAELPQAVTLVAVSKTKPAESVMEAYEAGHRDFGENYVQEMVEKAEKLPPGIRWHFIGHLQSNKVKYVAPFVHLIHGVDSLKLLKEIDRQGAKSGHVISCLLQVYIASEETKFGLSFEECEETLKASSSLQHVNVCGLMAMASNTADKESVRAEFRGLKNFHASIKDKYPALDILSFGMSGDYRLAIAEGSNMVRIGSLIFGARNYAK